MCNIVLHYCRLAPLATTAEDYKRGKDKREQGATMESLVQKTAKLQETLDYVSSAYETKLADLKSLIIQVEANNRPHEYVQNRNSGKTHKVLTRFSEVGLEAVAYCSYKYGKSQAKMLHTLDDVPRKLLCSTCLPEFRALPDR